jgi:hypothetical protein
MYNQNPQYPQNPQNPQYPQYPQPPYGYNQQSDCSLAIVSMIFGIASWVILWGVGAIVAIICGHIAKSQIASSQGRLKGGGMATAGLVLGYVQIGIGVLVVAGILIAAAVAASSGYSY